MTFLLSSEPVKVEKVEKATATWMETTVTASWEKPEGIITGYHLTCGLAEDKDSKVKELTLDDPDITTATFEELLPETDYILKIYAKNGKKNSERVKVKGKTSKLIINVYY